MGSERGEDDGPAPSSRRPFLRGMTIEAFGNVQEKRASPASSGRLFC